MKLLNKIAIITWWASGIWEATAREFYKSWAIVIITDINVKAWSFIKRIRMKFIFTSWCF